MTLHIKIFLCNWPRGQCIFSTTLWSFLWKGVLLHFDKTEIPSPKDALCSLEPLGQWFCRRRQYIFTMSLLYPLGKWCGFVFEQTWILCSHMCFVPSLFRTGPVVLEKKIFMSRQLTFTMSLSSTLEKRHNASFGQIWIPYIHW